MGETVDVKVYNMLKQHIQHFDDHIDNWNQHRREAKIAMSKVSNVESALKSLTPHIAHLSELPKINDNLRSMKDGLLAHNKALLGQNNSLLTPFTKSHSVVSNILMFAFFLAGTAIFIVLLRESNIDFTFGGDNGVKITGRHTQ